MSKIKKIAISILSGIMVIFGIHSMSSAYYVGQSLTVTYNEYANSSNILCVEHGQSLTQDNDYKIISNVKIEGRKSTDHEGKTIDNWRNAKFAYILSAANTDNQVQNEVWNYSYTWMKNVGKNHAGLYENFASTVKGSTTNLDSEATDYADNIGNLTKVTDNTKKDKITVEAYDKDGKRYMRIGPFNWSFAGKLTEVSIYDQNSKAISGKLYSTFSGKTEKWINVGDIKSDNDFYISIPADTGVSKVTKVSGKMSVDIKAVNIWFLESTTSYKQNLIIRDPYSDPQTIETPFDYDISILGNLKVIKVNKDNEQVRLAGVGFYIQDKNTEKYVKQEADGTISYVKNKEQATEFITDKNGEITIKDLIVGTYVAYETKNPNYGYEIISEGKEKNVVVDKTAELKIPNKQKYIKLSGYVWVDNISGKQSTINDIYSDKDPDDMLLDGITVRLKDRTTGKTVKEAITANGGKYLFTDVLVDDLDKYYIEFEYDGLTYTNVIPHIDKDNGSKSAENPENRETLNEEFGVIEGTEKGTEGIAKNANNGEEHRLTYDIKDHKAEISEVKPEPIITANTNETGYSIKAHFVPGEEEIKYINLGLYKREQPDISLVKDLYNVNVLINGHNNIYNYAQRFKEAYKPTEEDLNVGVKYKDKYTGLYYRPIYKADYIYNGGDNSKNLKVYLTYKIRLINETTGLNVKVNSIVDYFDKDYTLVGVGTKINEKGTITEKLSDNKISDISKDNNNNEYSKVTITTDTEIGSQGMSDIYVQFELNREAILKILGTEETPGTGELLDNVAEINSYSVFDKDGKVYAGIDKDSNPGNAVPGTPSTYEDDTDSAPSLKLEVTEARKMTGKVFLDSTSNELKTGEVREGDGEYKEGEKGIEGVQVTLTETRGTNQVYTATTDANGDFLIKDYIPGDYTLTYTWGDETYTVQNYKGTIYKDSDRANNKEWYKTTTPRYSDALDDYTLRKTIDNEATTIDKMNSTTPIMDIGVENIDTATSSIGNRYEYTISNIDFGIVERARQKLTIGKRVEKFKVTLANGQVITDVTINEDGTMEGKTNYIVYMGPSATTVPNNGFIKLELDNELIQGATVNIQYAITVTNNSEVDYDTDSYYLYGIKGTESQIIRYMPSEIYDYLDNTLSAEESSSWEIKDTSEYYDQKSTILEEYYTEDSSTLIDPEGNIVQHTGYDYFKEWYDATEWKWEEIKTIRERRFADKTILYNKEGTIDVLPGKTEKLVALNASKVLANSDDISLNNDVEITKITRKGETGRTLEINELYDRGETVTITPPTGENSNFIVPAIVGAVALVILAAGVVLIKKKTL